MGDSERLAAYRSNDSETNPLCIYLVQNDSKGDKPLLFRYPYWSFGGSGKMSSIEHKRTLHKDATMDMTERPHELSEFSDDAISSLFAVKTELCDRKFEMKVNNVRFIGHPMQIQAYGGTKKKSKSPSIIMINIVFALDAFARRQIGNCYYDLSKVLGVAIEHEEKRCAYLSSQIRDMLMIHDSMASSLDCDLDCIENTAIESGQHFEKILSTCSLAQDLKQVFEDVCTSGLIKLKVNNWVEVSFCLPHKVHRFYKDGQYFEPESINKCLKGLRPYHGLLLLSERKVLLDNLPQDSSPSIVRLINMYNPVKSLQTLSADSDLTLAQVFNIAGHLIYWGDAIVIFPLSENNMYAIAPNVPTERNNPFTKEFEEKFPEHNLLEGYYTDDSFELQEDDNSNPSEVPMTTYQLLSENWLQVSSGGYNTAMSSAEEMFHILDEDEQMALMHIPASANPDDFRLLMRLLKQGYLAGTNHIEEIMYLENIRRSELLKLLDKFKEVLVTVEMEDPTIGNFYSR